MNEDVRTLRNLTTRKSTSRGILADILTKTSETCKLTPKYMLETFQCVEFSIDHYDKHIKNPRL